MKAAEPTAPEPCSTVAGNVFDGISSATSKMLSVTVLIILNIIVSGHLLGYVLGLENGDNNKNHITVPIPFVCKVSVNGWRAIAGLSSFSLALFIVIFFFVGTAEKIFIYELGITRSKWIASQSLASLISVVFCITLSILRVVVDTILNALEGSCTSVSSDDNIINSLTTPSKRD